MLNSVSSRRLNHGAFRFLYMQRGQKRLSEILKDQDVNQTQLGDAIGLTKGRISQLKSENEWSSDVALSLHKKFGYSIEWAKSGRGLKFPGDNFSDAPELRAKIPVISWATAGHWADVQDPFSPGEAEDWVQTTKTVGPNAFALRVVGDSMEPKLADGVIVIIDPAASYSHGKIVLAKRTQDQQATLKQLWYDGGEPKLRPLNPRYPILDMPTDTRIIGVAVTFLGDL